MRRKSKNFRSLRFFSTASRLPSGEWRDSHYARSQRASRRVTVPSGPSMIQNVIKHPGETHNGSAPTLLISLSFKILLLFLTDIIGSAFSFSSFLSPPTSRPFSAAGAALRGLRTALPAAAVPAAAAATLRPIAPQLAALP